MRRPSHYHTRQREAVLAYIASLGDGHATAAQIVDHFAQERAPIGRTTVYRHLDRLVESGRVRRYSLDNLSGACFQYVGGEISCTAHWHLKCEDCGTLLHLRCEALDEIQRHMLDKHTFQVNTMKIVLYGKCDRCLRGE